MSRRRLRAAAVLTLCAAAGALAMGARHRAASIPRRPPGLRVLLVTIDTLRADALGAYGNRAVETPIADRLAREGVRFEQAHAQSVVTLPSHANILSGLYPMQHRIRDNAGFRFPAGEETLATLLHAQGYATGAFVSAFPLESRFGLARGFDVYDDRFTNVDTRTAFVMEERRGPDTVALAKAWMDAQGDRPFFCWVHLYEPHFPYEPPAPFAERYARDPYLGEVSAADAALAPLLQPILDAGASARTMIVLTADHGESLGEHGEQTHGIFAYESTLHVPLIVWEPGLFAPAVVPDVVRHVDVLPTVLDILAQPPRAGRPGRSLMPLLAGGSLPGAPSYFESLSSAKNRGWAPLYGMLAGGLKLIDLPLPELYDLGADPHETRNLAATRGEAMESLRGRLSSVRDGDPGWRGTGESAEARERLSALGYVAASHSAAPRAFTADDDPKRLIGLDAALQEAVARYKAGDVDRAVALCEDVLRRRPQMTLALSQVAFLYREQGRLPEAIAALERSLMIDPEDAATAALLGGYLVDAGQAGRARQVLEPYARLGEPDVDVLLALGVAQAQDGRAKDALATFTRVQTIDPSSPMPLLDAATVHLQARDYDAARRGLEAALVLNPRLARAHNALGVIAAETGHSDEAIARWQRAVELEPHDADTLYNLGRLLRRAGRDAEARSYLQRYVAEAGRSGDAQDVAEVREWLSRAR